MLSVRVQSEEVSKGKVYFMTSFFVEVKVLFLDRECDCCCK